MSRQIRVRVSPNGEIRVEAYGFKGSGCEAATQALEEALGKKVLRMKKPDYWIPAVVQQGQQTIGEGEG